MPVICNKTVVRGIGGPGQKFFLFILMYVIALSFSSLNLGHVLLNYQNFLFYEHLHEGRTTKYMDLI